MRGCAVGACLLLAAVCRADPAGSGAADPPPPKFSAADVDLPQAQLERLLADLLRDERAYAGNPDFDYVLGVVALRANANTIALLALERVVLQSPERAGAWIDLAIAHARLGETETAATLLDYVEEGFPVPPALRAALDRARRQLLAAKLARGWHGEVSASLGFDSNANSGLSIDRLTLTLDGVPAEYLIAPDFHVRSDSFVQLGGRLRRTWDTSLGGRDGRFTLQGTLRAKDYRQEKDFNLADGGVMASYQQPLGGGEGELAAGTQNIRLGGSPLVNITHVQLAWGYRLTDLDAASDCRAKAGPESELRSYLDRHYLDGKILWLAAQVSCTSTIGDTALSLKAGSDAPREARPGGRTQRSELSLFHRTKPWRQLGAEISLAASRSSDADGYSPILDGGSRRRIDRLYANAALTWPVSAGIEGLASLEMTRQRSNIAIFDQNGRVMMLGLRYRF